MTSRHPAASRRVVHRSRLSTPLLVAALLAGCNAMFDIEHGTLVGDAGEGGEDSSGATGGKGGTSGGKGGASGGKGGASGGSSGSSGGTDAPGGTTSGGKGASGGTDASGGTSSGGKGGTASGNGGTSGNGGSAGSGGSSAGGSAGTNVTPITIASCACASGTPDTDPLLIQDFEDRTAGILPFEGRSGGFYTFTDDYGSTADGVLACATGEPDSCAMLCMRGFLDGSGYPYAALGVTLHGTTTGPRPYDISAYSGLSFRVSGTVPSNQAALRVTINTTSTSAVEFGGNCVDIGAIGCNDHYKAPVPVSPTFSTEIVHFVDLGQGDGGHPWLIPWGVPGSWTPTEALNINWEVNAIVDTLSGVEFDVCIDDIKFIGPPSRQVVATYDFEGTTDGFADLGGDGAFVLAPTNQSPAVGDGALEAILMGPGGEDCTGTADCSIATTFDACTVESGCTWDAACVGTPTYTCASALDDWICQRTPGCTYNYSTSFFGQEDLPASVTPAGGDIVGVWFKLPQGDLFGFGLHFVDATDTWGEAGLLAFEARRDDWIYAEFQVPPTLVAPMKRFGLQAVTAPGFSGSIFIDDLTIYRP